MEEHRFSVSTVTQGDHRFYTCTIPSDVLARCCFVSNRFDDPVEGFQRVLDESRARDIAHYIDNQLGTIPTSIILSAQEAAELQVVGRGKTLSFKENKKAFLVLDGQHRVFGFSLAKTNLRVPVVIYNGLSRRDETRLFIDINSKQKGVPNELLLDIKKLAEYENNEEATLREVFDLFDGDLASSLYGLLSPAKRSKNKISRVTFKHGVSPVLVYFRNRESEYIFKVLNSYLIAFKEGLSSIECEKTITSSVVFRGIMGAFPVVVTKVKDRYGADYSVNHFHDVLKPVFNTSGVRNKFVSPGTSPKALVDFIETGLKTALVV